MGLNIKNEATCALARELADLTGETMTGATDQMVILGPIDRAMIVAET